MHGQVDAAGRLPKTAAFHLGALLAAGLFLFVLPLTGCSYFSPPQVECGASESTESLSTQLLSTGEPVSAIVMANFSNDKDAMLTALQGDHWDRDVSKKFLKALDSFEQSKKDAFEVLAVITKERKSRTSATCQADVHFRGATPLGVDNDLWKQASQNFWRLNYTAEMTDNKKQVLVTINGTECHGPACEIAKSWGASTVVWMGQAGEALKKLNAQTQSVTPKPFEMTPQPAVQTASQEAVQSAPMSWTFGCGSDCTVKTTMQSPVGEVALSGTFELKTPDAQPQEVALANESVRTAVFADEETHGGKVTSGLHQYYARCSDYQLAIADKGTTPTEWYALNGAESRLGVSAASGAVNYFNILCAK